MEKAKEKTVRKPCASSLVTAADRCKAVLSIWTEKRKPSEVCKELSVPWNVLDHWQKRAMEGILQALEPRVNLEKAPALSPKLLQLLSMWENSLLNRLPESRTQQRLVQRLAAASGKPQKAEPVTTEHSK